MSCLLFGCFSTYMPSSLGNPGLREGRREGLIPISRCPSVPSPRSPLNSRGGGGVCPSRCVPISCFLRFWLEIWASLSCETMANPPQNIFSTFFFQDADHNGWDTLPQKPEASVCKKRHFDAPFLSRLAIFFFEMQKKGSACLVRRRRRFHKGMLLSLSHFGLLSASRRWQGITHGQSWGRRGGVRFALTAVKGAFFYQQFGQCFWERGLQCTQYQGKLGSDTQPDPPQFAHVRQAFRATSPPLSSVWTCTTCLSICGWSSCFFSAEVKRRNFKILSAHQTA